jgi:dihydroorotate dehydrogenase (NAD+) catalytic subunit
MRPCSRVEYNGMVTIEVCERDARFPLDLTMPFDLNVMPLGEATVSVGRLLSMPRTVAGFDISFPIGVPASVITPNSRWIEFYGRRGFEILTYKTVRSEMSIVHPFPNWLFADRLIDGTPSPTAIVARGSSGTMQSLTMVNSYGVPSLSEAVWMADVRRARTYADREHKLLVVSVMGSVNDTETGLIDDFVRVALMAREAGAHVVELNYSCPNVPNERSGLLYRDTRQATLVATAVKEALGDVGLFIKIGCVLGSDLEELFRSVVHTVDGIVATNTLMVNARREANRDAFPPAMDGTRRSHAGLSGSALKRYAFEVNRQLVQLRNVTRQPVAIIATGGAMSSSDVADYLAVGVDAVQMCTAAFLNPCVALDVRRDTRENRRLFSEVGRLSSRN